MEEKLLEAVNLAAAWSTINTLHCKIHCVGGSRFLICTCIENDPIPNKSIIGSGESLNAAALDFLKELSK